MASEGTALDSVSVRAKAAIVSSFVSLTKNHPPTTKLNALASRTLAFAQMLSFAIASRAGLPWQYTIRPAQIVVELTTIPGYLAWISPTVFVAAYSAALAFIFFQGGIFLWLISRSFRGASFQASHWQPRVLQACGRLASGLLFIPLMFLVLSGFNCGDEEAASLMWSAIGSGCTGVTAVRASLSAIALLLLLIMALLWSLLDIDAHPLSSSGDAKVNGRVDAGMLLCKAVLVAIVTVWPLGMSPMAAPAVIFVSAAFWASALAACMPYHAHTMNRLQLAFACTLLWAAFCLLLAVGYPGFDAAVMLYIGSPLASIAGVMLADTRASRLFAAPVASLWMAHEVELKARYVLHACLWGHPTAERASSGAAAAAGRGNAASSGRADEENALTSSSDGGGLSGGSKGGELTWQRGASAAEDALDNVEARTRVVRALLSRDQLASIERVLTTGAVIFTGAPMLHIAIARFYGVLGGCRHLLLTHLLRAARLHPGLDAEVLVAELRELASSSDFTDSTGMKAADGHTSDVSTRVSFDSELASARLLVLRALRSQVTFWALLKVQLPVIHELHAVTSELSADTAAAALALASLLKVNRTSVHLLQLYTQFLAYAVNDTANAELVIAETEQAEEVQRAAFLREAQVTTPLLACVDLDIMADTTAVIRLGCSPENLGVILSASHFATKLFGYPVSMLERRNISMLMPSPLSELHHGFMTRFLTSGVGKVVGYTRVVFGKHRNHSIFPLVMAVREVADEHGALTLIGILRELHSSVEHILMDADCRVTACTANSFTLLGIQPETLDTSEKPRISEWVSNWATSQGALSRGAEVRLCVREQHQQTGPQSSNGAAFASSSFSGSGHYIAGHLQRIPLPGSQCIHVLHWRHDDAPAPALHARCAQVCDVDDEEEEEEAAPSSVVGAVVAYGGLGGSVRGVSHSSDSCNASGGGSDTGRTDDLLHFTSNAEPTRGPHTNRMKPNVSFVSNEGGLTPAFPESKAAAGTTADDGSDVLVASRADSQRGRRLDNALQPSLNQPTLDHRARARLSVTDGPNDSHPKPPHRLSVSAPLQAVVCCIDSGDGEADGTAAELQGNGAVSTLAATESARSARASAKATDLHSVTLGGQTRPLPPPRPSSQMRKGSAAIAVTSGGGDDERGSYASSHASEAAVRIQDRIRLVVNVDASASAATDGAHLLPKLRFLRNLAIIVSCLVAMLAIGLAAYLNQELATSLATFEQLRGTIAEVGSLDALLQQAQALLLCSLGWVPCSALQEQGVRAELLRVAAGLSNLHLSLESAAGVLGMQDLYSEKRLPIDYLYTGLDVVSGDATNDALVMESLIATIFAVQAKAAALAVEPSSAITMQHLALRFVIANVGNNRPLTSGVNRTLIALESVGKANVSKMGFSSQAVFGTLVGVVLGLTLFGILPLVSKIHRDFDATLLPFVQGIPLALVARLQAAAETHVHAVEAAAAGGNDNGEGGGGDDSDDEHAVGGLGGAFEGTNDDDEEEGSERDGGDPLLLVGDCDWGAVVRKLGVDDAAAAARHSTGTESIGSDQLSTGMGMGGGTSGPPADEATRTQDFAARRQQRLARAELEQRRRAVGAARSSWSPLLRLCLRFVAPFLALLAFCITLHLTTITAVARADGMLTAALAAGFLAQEASALPQRARSVVMQPGSAADVASIAAECAALASTALFHERLLEYGAPTTVAEGASNVVTSGIGLSAPAAAAVRSGMFNDGCTFVRTAGVWSNALSPPYNDAACRAVGGGVVSRGLHGAIASVASTAAAMCIGRTLADVPNDGTGVGVSHAANGAIGAYSAPAVLTSAAARTMANVTDNYVSPGLQGLVSVYLAAGSAITRGHQSFVIIFVAACMGAFILFVLAVYLPGVRALNMTLKRQRTLLLVVPAPLLRKLSELRDAADRLLESEDAARAGVQKASVGNN